MDDAQTAAAGIDLVALQRFFNRAVPGVGRIQVELVSGGRSNLTFRVSDGQSTWILRRPPLGVLTPSAHDMAREFRVAAALQGTKVPVAQQIILVEAPDVLGVPFSVVEHVDGRVIRSRAELHALSDAEITSCAYSLIEVLAQLHEVDAAEVGLQGFGRAQGYLSRQLRRWLDQWMRVATRELDDVVRLHARLCEACPTESGESIVHGDFRIDNAILDPADAGTVRAVVDWEMATLGDPLADLGLHIAYADPAFDPVLGGAAACTSPRLPTADAIVARYAAASGRVVDDLSFYVGLGYFKASVIAEGIHARHERGMTIGSGFDTVGGAVPQLASAGLAAIRKR